MPVMLDDSRGNNSVGRSVGRSLGGLLNIFRPPPPPPAQNVGSAARNLGNIGQQTVGNVFRGNNDSVGSGVGSGISGNNYSGGGGGGSYSGGGGNYGGSSNYNSGGGGGGGGGGWSSPAPTATLAPPPPPPPPPPVMETITIPDPLADPTYQKQKAQLQQAASDFNASQGLQRSQYDNTVNENMRKMGWRSQVPVQGLRAQELGQTSMPEGWDPTARGTAFGDSFRNNEGDFAGRGMLYSGLYGQANADMTNDFNDRRSGILTAQKDWRDTQDLTKRGFQNQQKATDEQALSDVVAAIAAKYGVNLTDVISGRSHQITRQVS